MATKVENANIIIKLSKMGFSTSEIVEFIGFIETHEPSEEEVMQALEEAKKRENREL